MASASPPPPVPPVPPTPPPPVPPPPLKEPPALEPTSPRRSALGCGGGLYVIIGTLLVCGLGIVILNLLAGIARKNPDEVSAELIQYADRWWLVLLLSLPAFAVGFYLVRRGRRPFAAMLIATGLMLLPLLPVLRAFSVLISELYTYQDIG